MYPMYYYNLSGIIYIIPGILLAMYAQAKISSAYSKYRKIFTNSGLSGSEVARIILDNNNLRDVEIKMVRGNLSDHYDPRDKTLNLSEDIYRNRSIASVAVAAHEVGHAIQDELNYAPLKIRASLVPLANLGTQLSFLFIILGAFFSRFFIQLGIALFFFAVLFQIVTLPVELNASNRAIEELKKILPQDEIAPSRKMLNAAAMTYIASTLVAIGQFLRLISIFGRRD